VINTDDQGNRVPDESNESAEGGGRDESAQSEKAVKENPACKLPSGPLSALTTGNKGGGPQSNTKINMMKGGNKHKNPHPVRITSIVKQPHVNP
jgi:hypothetical protein